MATPKRMTSSTRRIRRTTSSDKSHRAPTPSNKNDSVSSNGRWSPGFSGLKPGLQTLQNCARSFLEASSYAILAAIFPISLAVKARNVCVLTLSRELNDSMAALAVSSSGASKMMRPS